MPSARFAFAAALACVPTSKEVEDTDCKTCLEDSRLLVEQDCSLITASGWSAASPFGVPAASLPPALRTWCLLTAPPGTIAPSLGLPTGRDDANVFPQSSLFAEVLWPSFRARFLQETSALTTLDLGSVALGGVDVAVVDDAADRPGEPGEPGEGMRAHGRTLGLMIRDVACPYGPPSDCPVYISNHRALQCNGGLSGTRTQLARSIFEAVTAWQERECDRQVSSKLIINLSVGFEPDNQPESRLVRRAIELAVCHGALVIGAAGNILPDGSGSGPLLPGGWETRATPASCASFAMTDPHGFVPSPATRPLVIAAGGVEAHDGWLSLITARPGGRPALAAAAFQAAVADPLTGAPGPSDVLTGSSVSAAVVSAISAVLWAFIPSLDPRDVVDTIRSSSFDLGVPADFGYGIHQHDNIKLARVCSSLAQACAMWSSPACLTANLSSCAPPNPSLEAWPIHLVEQDYFPNNDYDSCIQVPGGIPDTLCSPLNPANLPAPSCSGGERANVGPQPGDLGCPACAVDSLTDQLYITIDDNYKGDFIAKDVGFKRMTDGVVVYPYYALDLPILHAGDKLQVQLELRPYETVPSAGQAIIEFISMPYESVRVAPLAWW